MSVTEYLMRPGRFDVRLVGKPATSTQPAQGVPASILSAARLADFVVVTPNRLQPVDGFSDANILSVAIYSGVINDLPNRYAITGQGLSWFMGTDEGLGDLLLTSVYQEAATLQTWITALKPASISAGTVTNTGTSYTGGYQYMTPREAITHLCRTVGAEWRINPNNTLDAAAPATLFGATAKGLITRKPEGSEGTLRGFEATDIEAGSNLSGYTTTTVVVGKTGDDAKVAEGSASGANVYKDFLNANMVMERLVDAPQEAAATVTAYATKVQALFGSVRRSITVNTRTFAVPLDVKPGSYVYVYDPDSNTVDTSVQQQWRGETISPVLLRCKGYTWGLKKGMGVYIRTAAGVYTDISDWVAWENEMGTSWELGSSSTDVDQNPDQLGTAHLGANGTIVNRITDGRWTTAAATGSAQNGIGTSATLLTNIAATITASGVNRYNVTFVVAVRQRTGAGTVQLDVYETNVGTGTILHYSIMTLPTDGYFVFTGTFSVIPAAGSRTYRIRLWTSANTVDAQPLGSSTPGSISVTDMGPS